MAKLLSLYRKESAGAHVCFWEKMVAGPVMRRRREDEWVFRGAGALLLMVGTVVAQEEGGDVAVEGEGDGEPSRNSSLAKEVEVRLTFRGTCAQRQWPMSRSSSRQAFPANVENTERGDC